MNYTITYLKLLELEYEAENNIYNFLEYTRVNSIPRTIREIVNNNNNYNKGNRFYSYR
jgi:hypothetical protein